MSKYGYMYKHQSQLVQYNKQNHQKVPHRSFQQQGLTIQFQPLIQQFQPP